MDIDIVAWLSLALRWLHVITGIAWIGSSFYFIWLDNHLRNPKVKKEGVAGEVWSVHGGGFYHKQKYSVAPETMPDELHWFKYEAYFTWISGFLLLAVIYYYGANLFLIDQSKAQLETWQGILIGLGALVASWLIYDTLCKSILGDNNLTFGIVWYITLLLGYFVLNMLLSDRGAVMHLGAMIGTVMAANVFFVIIPNQKITVGKLEKGEIPDAALGIRAKQRSLHNNYMTLPVLLIMISNHYPMTYSSDLSWLIIGGLGLSGLFIRHFFNLRHKEEENYIVLGSGVACFIIVTLIASLKFTQPAVSHNQEITSYQDIALMMKHHCTACHSANPTHPDFDYIPGDIALESQSDVEKYADLIREQAVDNDIMPLGNETAMTEEERQRLGQWLKSISDK